MSIVNDQIDEGHSYIELAKSRIYFDASATDPTALGMTVVDSVNHDQSVGEILTGTDIVGLIRLLAEHLRRMEPSDKD